MYTETVVFANTFATKKTGEVYTRLFVPVGTECVGVLVKGDHTGLTGQECNFNLTCRDGQLQLRLVE